MSEICIIESDKIENGSYMFWGSLGTYSESLPNLDLRIWDSSLSSLKNGYYMFNGCIKLSSFTGNLGALEDGTRMFSNCVLDKASISNIVNGLPTRTDTSQSITIGADISLINDSDIPNLSKIATDKGWTNKVEFNRPIEKQLQANRTSGNIHTEYNDYGYVFNNEEPLCFNYLYGINSTSTTSSITGNLTGDKVVGYFPVLENTYYAFAKSPNLTTVVMENMPKLVKALNMFYQCPNLESVTIDSSNIVYAPGMFKRCPNLTTFNGSLANLGINATESITTADAMFTGCKLNADSVRRILTTLSTIPETETDYFYFTMDESAVDTYREITGDQSSIPFNHTYQQSDGTWSYDDSTVSSTCYYENKKYRNWTIYPTMRPNFDVISPATSNDSPIPSNSKTLTKFAVLALGSSTNAEPPYPGMGNLFPEVKDLTWNCPNVSDNSIIIDGCTKLEKFNGNIGAAKEFKISGSPNLTYVNIVGYSTEFIDFTIDDGKLDLGSIKRLIEILKKSKTTNITGSRLSLSQSLYDSTEFRNYITSTAYKDLFTNTAGYPTIQVKNAKNTTKQIIFLVKS